MTFLKTSSLALGAIAIMAGAASAADLPSRKSAPPLFASPAFSWTGFYIGANAGIGFGSNNGNANSVFLPANSVIGSLGTSGTLSTGRGGSDDNVFVGGGQLGYNYQLTPGRGLVVGIEADLQYVNMRGRNGAFAPGSYTFVPTTALSNGLAFAPPAATVLTNDGGGMDYLGTLRGRVGYAFDNVLVYATGGLAYAGGSGSRGGGDSDGKIGYAAGGGVEYAFTPNWSAKIEGLYVSIDRGNNRGGGAVFNAATNTVVLAGGRSNDRQEIGLVRAGVNYRF